MKHAKDVVPVAPVPSRKKTVIWTDPYKNAQFKVAAHLDHPDPAQVIQAGCFTFNFASDATMLNDERPFAKMFVKFTRLGLPSDDLGIAFYGYVMSQAGRQPVLLDMSDLSQVERQWMAVLKQSEMAPYLRCEFNNPTVANCPAQGSQVMPMFVWTVQTPAGELELLHRAVENVKTVMNRVLAESFMKRQALLSQQQPAG